MQHTGLISQPDCHFIRAARLRGIQLRAEISARTVLHIVPAQKFDFQLPDAHSEHTDRPSPLQYHMVRKQWMKYHIRLRFQCFPVDPNPPLPRLVSSSSSLSSKQARSTGAMTSWAILSPGSTVCRSSD